VGYPTPEAAARGSIPEQYGHVLHTSLSPDGRHALVLLGTNEPPELYPYQVLCERQTDGWVESVSGNGPGWSSTSDPGDPENAGVATDWGEAPPAAHSALVRFDGTDHEAPVNQGYFLFVAWGVSEDRADAAPGLGSGL
jgi:hypothetical protein